MFFFCKSNFVVTEELLELIPLRGTATGEYIFVREFTKKNFNTSTYWTGVRCDWWSAYYNEYWKVPFRKENWEPL